MVQAGGAHGGRGEIFVLDMGDPVRIIDLAHDMIRLSGLEPERDIAIEVVGIRTGEARRGLFESWRRWHRPRTPRCVARHGRRSTPAGSRAGRLALPAVALEGDTLRAEEMLLRDGARAAPRRAAARGSRGSARRRGADALMDTASSPRSSRYVERGSFSIAGRRPRRHATCSLARRALAGEAARRPPARPLRPPGHTDRRGPRRC